jgi:tight adherence protein C
MQILIISFLIVFLLISSGLMLLFNQEKMGQRLVHVIDSGQSKKPARPSKTEQLTGTVQVFAGAVQKAVPKGQEEVSLVKKKLILAGYRQSAQVHLFYASKAVRIVLFCFLVAMTGVYESQPIVIFALAIGLGYLAPDYALSYKIKARQEAINLGLPDTLDLLVVCLEAGLSLDQSIWRTSDELGPSHPALADELKLVMLEVKAGKSRAEAWKAMVARTDVDETRALVSVFLQADQFGTSVSKTLRVHSESLRTRRTQRLEELAAKTSIKLVFPLVLFIFPSLFVVTLGSAMLQISAALGGKQ